MPVQVTCSVSPCDVQLTLNVPIWAMDTEDAALVSAAILIVWATAYAFRVLIRALNVDRNESVNSED